MVKKSGCKLGEKKVNGKCVLPKFIKKDSNLFTKVKPIGVFISPKIWKDEIGQGKIIMMKSEEKGLDTHRISEGIRLVVHKSNWYRDKYAVGKQSATGYDEDKIIQISKKEMGKSIYPARYSIRISNVRDTLFDNLSKSQVDRIVKNLAKSF